MTGVGLGGGSRGDTIAPVLLRATAATVAGWTESDIIRGISSYRTIVFFVSTQAFGIAGQLQLRINWYYNEGSTGVPFSAVRRNAAQDLVADEPLLPVTAAGAAGRFAVPVANPGGATGVSIGWRPIANLPNLEIHYSGES